jgi:beta-phosphoglucomutase-like phosphatase (HAD superfamily)
MTRTQAIVFDMDGVLIISYLQELQTSNAKFVLQNGIEGSK